MNFTPYTFESIARRKKLAGWLMTLKGPAKVKPQCANSMNQINWDAQFAAHQTALQNAAFANQSLQNSANYLGGLGASLLDTFLP